MAKMDRFVLARPFESALCLLRSLVGKSVRLLLRVQELFGRHQPGGLVASKVSGGIDRQRQRGGGSVVRHHADRDHIMIAKGEVKAFQGSAQFLDGGLDA